MIKNHAEYLKQMDELEVLIKETDKDINKAYLAVVLMVEPFRSMCIKELEMKKKQLEVNKSMLEYFKRMTGV